MDIHTILIQTESGKVPEYATSGSSGFDIQAYLSEPITVKRGEIVKVPTGLKMALPKGTEVQIRSRSGLTLNHGVVVANSPGTIDSDYRGEVCIIMTNLKDTPFVIENGMKIAQGVLCIVDKAAFTKVESLPSTDRGDGGFGSTGLK